MLVVRAYWLVCTHQQKGRRGRRRGNGNRALSWLGTLVSFGDVGTGLSGAGDEEKSIIKVTRNLGRYLLLLWFLFVSIFSPSPNFVVPCSTLPATQLQTLGKRPVVSPDVICLPNSGVTHPKHSNPTQNQPTTTLIPHPISPIIDRYLGISSNKQPLMLHFDVCFCLDPISRQPYFAPCPCPHRHRIVGPRARKRAAPYARPGWTVWGRGGAAP